MSKQNARAGKLTSDRTKQKGSAVRVGIPGMHQNHGVSLVSVIPNREILWTVDRILMQVGMKFDERRLMEVSESLKLFQGFSFGIRIHRDIASETCGILPQNIFNFLVPSRAIVVTGTSRGDGQRLDVQ